MFSQYGQISDEEQGYLSELHNKHNMGIGILGQYAEIYYCNKVTFASCLISTVGAMEVLAYVHRKYFKYCRIL
jgi:hypothetical protein